MIQRRVNLLLIGTLVPFAALAFVLLQVEDARSGVNHTSESAPLSIGADDKITPDLLEQMAQGKPNDGFRFIVLLMDKAGLPSSNAPLSREVRRAQIVTELRQTATRSQAGLRKELQAMQNAQAVSSFRPLWIVNAIAVSGTATAIRQIAARPEVAQVKLDVGHRFVEPPSALIGLGSPRATRYSSAVLPAWGQARIGAPYAWHGLGVDGAGTTIAIMDTGVDWQHPDLIDSYRGNLAGSVSHAGNWFNTVVVTDSEPIDPFGHGTHVAGTAVGRKGIGTAPGAQWMAVNIVDGFGFIYESNVHSGFQYLMAPNGDPSLAPDIVNNSWGGSPFATAFVEDLKALNAAGIITVFAAGNEGPFPATINSPASYPGALAVAATDDIDEAAWFSSRGPSPLTSETKPWIAAPGTEIFSTLPDDQYGLSTGTSTATPHVAGAIALLLSAEPSLTQFQVEDILATTAAPISDTHPNFVTGWGRLDAYHALLTQIPIGVVEGKIHSGIAPLARISVTLITPGGYPLIYETDDQGGFRAAVRPGQYELQVSPFAYFPREVAGISVSVGQTVTQDINLMPLPVGAVEGIVTEAQAGKPLPAEIRVLGTPIKAFANNDGHYLVTLPAGSYELMTKASGHRIGRVQTQVRAGQTSEIDFSLDAAPSILLVDSGQWYYESYADYYGTGFFDVDYDHELWAIRNPFQDVPTAADLEPYDVVVWSSPLDSPGYLDANNVITDYLGTGGALLISGQNVGSHDGYGSGTQIWWYRDLEANLEGKTPVSQTITGVSGTALEGLVLRLNGTDSADNQTFTDATTPRSFSLTSPSSSYEDGQAASLQAGHCDPFRLAYYGFGLEGVRGAADRATLLNNTIDYLVSPPTESGVTWVEDPVIDFALPGSTLVYTLTVRNLSETVTDTFFIDSAPTVWSTSLTTKTLTLGSCKTGQTVLTIEVPGNTERDFNHATLLSVISAHDDAVSAEFELRHKTPGHTLLVDDDRWYDQEAVFQNALDAIGLDYDVWEIGWDDNVRGSPPGPLLNGYDLVVWYTGYDWFRPVNSYEEQALADYVAQGGRLFLNSQDFMYYHHDTPLARDHLGVIEYRESVTPTQIYAGDNPALSSRMSGPLPLTYGLYLNFSDGLIPGPDSQSFTWHDQGMPAGIASKGSAGRSVFWAFPFETLPQTHHAAAMNDVVGWLSDLGESTFAVDSRTGAPGDVRTYTLTLRNVDSGINNFARVTNTVPASLSIQANAVSGGANYDPVSRELTWEGLLASGESHQIVYQAVPSLGLPAGSRIENSTVIHYDRHELSFTRTAVLWLDAPDLTHSTLTATIGSLNPVQFITYTLVLRNSGLIASAPLTAVVRLPDELLPVTDTLDLGTGSASLADGRILWHGDLDPGRSVTVSLVMTRKIALTPLWLPAAAYINDGVTDTIVRGAIPFLPPHRQYFPILGQQWGN